MLGLVALAVFGAWQAGWTLPTPDDAVTDANPVARAYQTTDAVNLRSGPSTSYAILDVLAPQTPVSVTGAARQGFLPVDVGGKVAWVSAEFLAPADSAARAPAGDALIRAGLVDTASAAEHDDAPEAEIVAEPTARAPEPTEAPLPTEAPVVTEAVATEAAPAEVVPDATGDAVETIAGEVEAEVAPAEPGERWIEVDRSTALVTLHEGETVVAVYQGKIGRDPSPDGYYSTAIGTFHVYMMNKELAETPFVEGVYLTDFVGFDPERSNGFHSPVRDAEGNVVNTQGTVTMGCVRLDADAAVALFDFASIGMRVEIHD
jgi:hypothetical protein